MYTFWAHTNIPFSTLISSFPERAQPRLTVLKIVWVGGKECVLFSCGLVVMFLPPLHSELIQYFLWICWVEQILVLAELIIALRNTFVLYDSQLLHSCIADRTVNREWKLKFTGKLNQNASDILSNQPCGFIANVLSRSHCPLTARLITHVPRGTLHGRCWYSWRFKLATYNTLVDDYASSGIVNTKIQPVT